MAQKSPKRILDAGAQYLGSVYAKALLGAADAASLSESVVADFDALMELLAELPQFDAFLQSPRVPIEAKLSVLQKALANKTTPEFLNFLKVVAKHERLNCLEAIHAAVRHMHNLRQNKVEVEITTAAPIDAPLVSAITQKLRASLGKELELTAEVNPDLIAGMMIRVGDTVYDCTVANQLASLRSKTLRQSAEAIRTTFEKFVSE